MDDRDTLEFGDFLASTIHDTKNSLGMLYNTVDSLLGQCQAKECTGQKDLFLLQYELRRLNHNFIRMLSLYKAQKNRFPIRLDYHAVCDCLDEAITVNEPLLSSKGITMELQCPEELFWTFDRELVIGILDSMLNNEYLYTKDELKISAGAEEGYLVIRLEDNGPGFPDSFLIDSRLEKGRSGGPVSFLTGSTSLGLYFSALVAGAHTREGRKGFIVTANGGAYGGSVFSLHLP
ncbi:MAG: HAMP domain-containing sensor histidine kinase [Deltaproteobacteria bacterium]|nr:HAMP domain-containing sensor histidine kinase [Deltaproteobacteria bacterium]